MRYHPAVVLFGSVAIVCLIGIGLLPWLPSIGGHAAPSPPPTVYRITTSTGVFVGTQMNLHDHPARATMLVNGRWVYFFGSFTIEQSPQSVEKP